MWFGFGGLTVSSSLDLPGLASVERVIDPDIRITDEYAEPDAPGTLAYRWGGRYGLRLERSGESWLIRCPSGMTIAADAKGRALHCRHADADSLTLLGDILVRRVLPRTGILHDRLVLHAATLAHDDGAVMLFGRSGTGKSTLSAALAYHLGWDIFSDDMSILTTGGQPAAWPVMRGSSLWRAASEALNLDTERCRPLAGYDGKFWHETRARYPHYVGKPLRALVFLGMDTNEPRARLQRLDGPEPFVMAASQLIRFNPADEEAAARLLGQLRSVISAVPCYGLIFPRGFENLPEVTAQLAALQPEAHVSGL